MMVLLSSCGKDSGRPANLMPYSLMPDDSLAVALADSLAAARNDSLGNLRLDSLKRIALEDSLARSEASVRNFPQFDMLMDKDYGNRGFSIKHEETLAEIFIDRGYQKVGKDTYVFNPGFADEVSIHIFTKKIENWRFEETPYEDISPYIIRTDLIINFARDEDVGKFMASFPRNSRQLKREGKTVYVYDLKEQ